jgi:hypothetical protein
MNVELRRSQRYPSEFKIHHSNVYEQKVTRLHIKHNI